MTNKNTTRHTGAVLRFMCLLLVGIVLNVSPLPAFATGTEEGPNAATEAGTDGGSEKQADSSEEKSQAVQSAIQSLPALSADNTQDENYILVEKTFSGLAPELIPDEFRVTVTSDRGDTYTLTKENLLAQTTDENRNVIRRWKIEGVGTGNYSVTESGEEVNGYTVTGYGEGKIEVKAADMTVLVPVHETTCSHTNWPVKVDGDSHLLFAATLTQGGVAVISRFPLSASQRAAVSEAVLKINGPWKNPVYFYSIEEQLLNGTGFELNGATITYSAASEEVIIGRTRNWQHVATLKYSLSEANNPEIALHNLYEPAVTNVTVRKQVSGNMADTEKRFAFTVSVEIGGENGNFTMNGEQYEGGATFFLKDSESVLLENIPIGAQVTVTEADYSPERYETTYSLDLAEKESGCTAVLLCTDAERHDILFVNRKEIAPDTGVLLDSFPYLLILGSTAIGSAIFLILRKRRNA